MMKLINIGVGLLTLIIAQSCKKLIEIPPPVDSITTAQVFSKDEQAISAVSGMYYKMMNTSINYANGAITCLTGMSSDELNVFDQSMTDFLQFQQNTLNPTNAYVSTNLWTNIYSTIYSANGIIEELNNSSGVHDSVKTELTGEAKFIRAFCYFYLINLYGDVPFLTSTDWRINSVLTRTSTTKLYETIVADLKDAQSLLSKDFSVGHGERIIPNKWAAIALLSRVYMYLEDWENAAQTAAIVINNTDLFHLASINDVFLKNNSESIWQLQANDQEFPYTSWEAFLFIPIDSISPTTFYLTNELLKSLDPLDLRRTAWLDSTLFEGQIYYYPFKYKLKVGNGTEYYTILRLAEQYLIKSEAEAHLNKLSESINDLNMIRSRAGIVGYTGTTNKDSILNAIFSERKIEFFCEWGHRWFDLKRTAHANSILPVYKGSNWQSTDQLYPIPRSELLLDPNLVQNSGY